jgi:hypothetical protein
MNLSTKNTTFYTVHDLYSAGYSEAEIFKYFGHFSCKIAVFSGLHKKSTEMIMYPSKIVNNAKKIGVPLRFIKDIKSYEISVKYVLESMLNYCKNSSEEGRNNQQIFAWGCYDCFDFDKYENNIITEAAGISKKSKISIEEVEINVIS